MPLYHHLRDLPRGGSSSGNGDQAPLVFWDGYGLENRRSGIFVHANELGRALMGIGVRPILMGNDGIHANLSDFDVISVKQGVFGALTETKLMRPTKCFSYLREIPNPFVYHGLSNINLPLLGTTTQARFVITIHDVIPLLAPRSVSKKYFLQFKALLAQVVSRADAVI